MNSALPIDCAFLFTTIVVAWIVTIPGSIAARTCAVTGLFG